MSAMMKSATRPAVSFRASKAAVPVVHSVNAAKMMVWTPENNKFFETFSFLPPLSDEAIAKQVDYVVNNGWVPCLEFASSDQAYAASPNAPRLSNGAATGYYDNRYWTMWKLPMFGCRDASQVLKEIVACTKAFPASYIRMVAFDSNRQVQVAGLLVHRPAGNTEFQAPGKRSV